MVNYMSLDPLSAAFDLGKSVIERIWPDANKRAEEIRKLEELKQNGDLAKLQAEVQLLLAQAETNKIQAQHKSLFVAGARPFIIWICGIGLGFQYILHPILTWVWYFWAFKGLPPDSLDMSIMMPLLLGMLGLGTMRSFDKSRGTQTDSIEKSK